MRFEINLRGHVKYINPHRQKRLIQPQPTLGCGFRLIALKLICLRCANTSLLPACIAPIYSKGKVSYLLHLPVSHLPRLTICTQTKENQKRNRFESSVRALHRLLLAVDWSKENRFEVHTKTITIKRGPPVTETPCPSVRCSWINYSRSECWGEALGVWTEERFVGISSGLHRNH